MTVVTTPNIPGKNVVRTLGLVRGNTIRARHVGKDIMAAMRNLVGGEVTEYAKLPAESREQALDRMGEQAEELDRQRGHRSAIPNLGRHGWRCRDDGLRLGRSRRVNQALGQTGLWSDLLNPQR